MGDLGAADGADGRAEVLEPARTGPGNRTTDSTDRPDRPDRLIVPTDPTDRPDRPDRLIVPTG
ncbi:hypothetical protein RKE30_32750 [Streptomyces sp. Li-HN-5-11]|uniref:hypothetical protein n=1 Tax=Streptomyces sp. Li-HN-5-11 TaxID=3075432 RepID=UPI0028B05E38|nr:hypothetical protein [Streptomyces sp. Li-HN-5-11]WNM34803.1 hypothetical protein RKE30_32750 [Streptomyces sp. Li-HN-5-11]